MSLHAHRDLLGRRWSISVDQNVQPVEIVVEAVSARHLCGKKMQKFVELPFPSINSDLRKGLSFSLERGGPQLTRSAMNEGDSPDGNCLLASSNVPQELGHESPRQDLKELPNISVHGNVDVKDILKSRVGTRHYQGTSFVRGNSRIPEDITGETNTAPAACARELKRYILQVGRGGGNIHIPRGSTTSEAIAILKNRRQQGIIIESYTFVEVLTWCSKLKDLSAARQLHDFIIQTGMDKNPYVATALLNVYIRCGRLRDARRVFDELEKKTGVTWRIMIAGYANNDRAEDALAVFNRMLQAGAQPGEFTCLSILKACCSPLALKWGEEVHAYIKRAGLESDVRVATALVQMYAKCGCISEARNVFDKLGTNRNVISWNVMIGAYAKSGCGLAAYRLFLQMQREGLMPTAITYLSILNASASEGALTWVKEVHSHARKAGLESDLRVGNVLVHMYAKCGSINDARKIFDRIEKRDVITWNSMIGAYAESACGVEAYRLFIQMQREGHVPDSITYTSILNASASAEDLEWVKEVDSHVRRTGFESDLRVSNALVLMYAKSGSIDDARLLFDTLKTRDVITWTVMIGAYAEIGCGVEAHRLFLQMEQEGFIPNAITYVSILNTSAIAGALDWVQEVRSHACKAGLESDLRVGTALVQMYAKSGSIRDARLIFDRMVKRDVITWTVMIDGLAQHGCGHEALELFRRMNADSVNPDGTTLLAVLKACCHAGLVGDGRGLFLAMMQDYGVEPTVEHYTCIVDLLGRAGQLEEAKLFIHDMPVEPDGVIWGALLGACRSYGSVELGEIAAKELLKLEPKDAGAYVLLSNIYAAAGKWEEVSLVRSMMRERGVRKEPGRSWIEVDNKIHDFVVGDISHPESKEIYTELSKLSEELKAEGYIPDTQLVLHNINREDKELALCSHSEKLAIVYGLMHTPSGKPIRVYKNLRVCSDCHTATKLISKVRGREVIARDANRFHHFKNGVCSCGDYW